MSCEALNRRREQCKYYMCNVVQCVVIHTELSEVRETFQTNRAVFVVVGLLPHLPQSDIVHKPDADPRPAK